MARAPARTTRCILSTTCDGALLCEIFLITDPKSMPVSMVGAPALTTRCILSITCGGILLSGNFFIKAPPKIPIRTALVGAPAVPPALPSRNIRITGRTFHARIYGSGTHPRDPLCTFYLVRRRPCSGKTFSSQAHPKSSTGRIWSGRPPSHPRFPLETFKIQAEPSMPVSMARAPILATRCILFTLCGGALALGKLFHHRPTQNPPPGEFGRGARRPTHASLSKLLKYRPNLL